MNKLLVGLCIGMATFGVGCSGQGITIIITQDQIQAQLDQRFPIEKSAVGIVKIVLSNPVLQLSEGADRIDFKLDTSVRLLPFGKGVRGSAHVSGKVRYNPEQGAFFFDDPTLESLRLEGIPDQYSKPLTAAASIGLREVIQGRPLYELDDEDTTQAFVKLFLRSVAVEDGVLKVRLGIS